MAKKGEPVSFLTTFMSKINWMGFRIKGVIIKSYDFHNLIRTEEYREKVSLWNAKYLLMR